MRPAPLPSGTSEHRGDGILQPVVGIGANQLHAAESPGVQGTQEGQPEGTIRAGSHVHPEDLPVVPGVRRRGHHIADIDDATCFPDLLGQGIQPEVGMGVIIQRPGKKLSTTSSNSWQMREI